LAFRLVITPLEVEIIAIPKSSKTLGNSFEFEYTRNPGFTYSFNFTNNRVPFFPIYFNDINRYFLIFYITFKVFNKSSSFKIDAIAKDILVAGI
jgi:hypothetical protein